MSELHSLPDSYVQLPVPRVVSRLSSRVAFPVFEERGDNARCGHINAGYRCYVEHREMDRLSLSPAPSFEISQHR